MARSLMAQTSLPRDPFSGFPTLPSDSISNKLSQPNQSRELAESFEPRYKNYHYEAQPDPRRRRHR
jgi:hypothetical protein